MSTRCRSPGRGAGSNATDPPKPSASHDGVETPPRSRYFGGYLSEHAVRGLRGYQYSGSDVSLFLTYVSNPIYNRIVLLFPLWLAPNVITLSGLMCTMASYVVFQYFCPHLYGVAPWWAYLLNAASILGYQALDAMDGKQARRTGTGSPLGLLFDHGCDAFNGTIMSLTMCSVAQMGPGLVSLAMWIFATGVFFTATVEEFYTGEMRLGIINGPNEGLLIAVFANLVTAVIGPGFWISSSPVHGVPWNVALLLLTILCGTVTMIENWMRIFHTIYCRRKGKPRRGRLYPELGKFNYFVAISRFAPFVVLCAAFFVWAAFSPSNVMQRNPRAMSWAMGFLFCKFVTALMVSHITNDEYHPMGKTVWLVLGVALQCLVQLSSANVDLWRFLSIPEIHQAWIDGRNFNMRGMPADPTPIRLFSLPVEWTVEDFVLYELLFITGVSYCHYVVRVVLEVSDALQISIFTIPYPNIGCKK